MGREKRSCAIEGCESPFYGRDRCSKHYQRDIKNGTLKRQARGTKPSPEEEARRRRADRKERYANDPDYAQKAKDRAAAYRAKNPEKLSEYFRQHLLKNRDKKLEYLRQWRLVNAEKVVADKKRWSASERGKLQRKVSDYKRKGAPFTTSGKEYLALIQNDSCVYCGGAGGSTDHIIPISQGGTGDMDNLAPSCVPCNSSKGTQTLLTFLLRAAKQSSA